MWVLTSQELNVLKHNDALLDPICNVIEATLGFKSRAFDLTLSFMNIHARLNPL